MTSKLFKTLCPCAQCVRDRRGRKEEGRGRYNIHHPEAKGVVGGDKGRKNGRSVRVRSWTITRQELTRHERSMHVERTQEREKERGGRVSVDFLSASRRRRLGTGLKASETGFSERQQQGKVSLSPSKHPEKVRKGREGNGG